MLGGPNNFTLMLFFNLFSVAALPLLAEPLAAVMAVLNGEIPFEVRPSVRHGVMSVSCGVSWVMAVLNGVIPFEARR